MAATSTNQSGLLDFDPDDPFGVLKKKDSGGQEVSNAVSDSQPNTGSADDLSHSPNTPEMNTGVNGGASALTPATATSTTANLANAPMADSQSADWKAAFDAHPDWGTQDNPSPASPTYVAPPAATGLVGQSGGGQTAAATRPASSGAPPPIAAPSAGQSAVSQVPTYQTYGYTIPAVGVPAAPALISPSSVASYQAGTVSQFQKAPGVAGLNDLATQLTQKLAQTAPTDIRGQEEAQKETLLALKQQAGDTLNASAGQRGVAQGGALTASLAGLEDTFAGDLTKSYRDITSAAQETDFQHLLSAAGLSNTVANSQSDQNRNDYSALLSGQMDQQSLYEAAAASAQSASDYQLRRDALTSQNASDQIKNLLASAGLTLEGQKAAASEGQFATSSDLQRAGATDAFTNADLARQLDVAKTNSAQGLQYGLAQDQLGYDYYNSDAQRQAALDAAGISAGASRYSADRAYDASMANTAAMSDADFAKFILANI